MVSSKVYYIRYIVIFSLVNCYLAITLYIFINMLYCVFSLRCDILVSPLLPCYHFISLYQYVVLLFSPRCDILVSQLLPSGCFY